jgi:RNA polymerase-binding transcription factor DksA
MAKSAPKKASAPAKRSAPSTGAAKAPAKPAATKAAPAPATKKAAATKAVTVTPRPPAQKAATKATAAPSKAAPSKAAASKAAASKAAPAKAPAAQAAPSKAASTKSGTAKAAAKAAPSKSGTEAAPKPKPVNPFDAKFLDGQRSLLLEERAKLVGQADHLDAEAAQLMEDLDPGDVQFDDESGEGDSLVVERERDLALAGQARQTVADIDAALRRIDEGVYGLSVISGRPIPKERLRALPWATELVEEKVGGLGTRR